MPSDHLRILGKPATLELAAQCAERKAAAGAVGVVQLPADVVGGPGGVGYPNALATDSIVVPDSLHCGRGIVGRTGILEGVAVPPEDGVVIDVDVGGVGSRIADGAGNRHRGIDAGLHEEREIGAVHSTLYRLLALQRSRDEEGQLLPDGATGAAHDPVEAEAVALAEGLVGLEREGAGIVAAAGPGVDCDHTGLSIA